MLWSSRLFRRLSKPARPTKVRKVRSFRPGVEGLEARSLMAASVFVVPLAMPLDAAHFHSLSAALPAAGAGGTVTIEPGAIADVNSVLISQLGLTIQGDPNVPGSILPRYDLELNASKVTLFNLNLGNVKIDAGVNSATVARSQVINISEIGGATGGLHHVLSQNVITGYVNMSGNSSLLIENNTFISSEPVILALVNSSSATVRDNTILGDRAGAVGIKVDSDSDQELIANNKIKMTGDSPIAVILGNVNGFHIMGAKVFNNTLDAGSTGTGLYIDLFSSASNFQAVVEGNDFRGNLVGVKINVGINGASGQIDLGGGVTSQATSQGGNNFHGFDGNSGRFAVQMLNVPTLAVSAKQNIFDGGISTNLVVADGSNGGGTGIVDTTNHLIGYASFVQTLYHDLLGRTASSTEIAGWVSVFNSSTQADVVNGILRSSESIGRIVDSYYIRFLGRHSEPAGQAYWINFQKAGHTEEQLESAFLTSPENQAHINTAFVQSLYVNILGRTGSAAELAVWNDQSQVLGLNGIANGFTGSQENRSRTIASYFEDLFHREPSSSDLAYWTNQPGDLLTLEAGILSTYEYLTKG
ncbi:hypothetical protein BH10PLA2_BH10PLA2_15160 [soil metagenome]